MKSSASVFLRIAILGVALPGLVACEPGAAKAPQAWVVADPLQRHQAPAEESALEIKYVKAFFWLPELKAADVASVRLNARRVDEVNLERPPLESARDLVKARSMAARKEVAARQKAMTDTTRRQKKLEEELAAERAGENRADRVAELEAQIAGAREELARLAGEKTRFDAERLAADREMADLNAQIDRVEKDGERAVISIAKSAEWFKEHPSIALRCRRAEWPELADARSEAQRARARLDRAREANAEPAVISDLENELARRDEALATVRETVRQSPCRLEKGDVYQVDVINWKLCFETFALEQDENGNPVERIGAGFPEYFPASASSRERYRRADETEIERLERLRGVSEGEDPNPYCNGKLEFSTHPLPGAEGEVLPASISQVSYEPQGGILKFRVLVNDAVDYDVKLLRSQLKKSEGTSKVFFGGEITRTVRLWDGRTLVRKGVIKGANVNE